MRKITLANGFGNNDHCGFSFAMSGVTLARIFLNASNEGSSASKPGHRPSKYASAMGSTMGRKTERDASMATAS